ncbi:ATP-binding cassette domain-containing protein [Turicibacter sanguinis]|uniref:ATP-binding cassette domain-containing protein n=1 Tax=Turicibacter sanguinis TaxID=154288 RepID=A0A6G2CPV9_9FIRM|nr:ATP-binding cassette domain-containing protein [Turicibacter sanguinis]MTK81926.1 ATP-binding cassette domain-containing protein [Turicibacter sanguinis]MTK84250.1 ATP-binding cassette domain-containing protein [Turicibacter sanguinis]MTK86696.1 ATP-binding cassette domain-containing protein [Turicibacter sanguinis]MTK95839.1 ATP-binding cassette domain-containing protein [Turicibacter sanguinis]
MDALFLLQEDFNLKQTLHTLKWIFTHSIPVLPSIILTSILAGALSAIGVYSALLSKSLMDAATSGEINAVIKWLIMMAFIYFVRLSLNIINSLISTYTSTTLFNQMQKKLYQSLTYSQWLDGSKYHSVNLLSRLTNDVSTVTSVILSTLNSIVSLSVTLISSFIALLYLDPFIALFTMIATPIYLLGSRLYGRKLKAIYRAVQDQDIHYRAFIQESIQNLMIVKAFCHEEENFHTLDDYHQERLRLRFKSTKLSLLSSIIFGTISFFIYFIVYGISTLKLASNQLTFGSMTALLQLYTKVSGPLSSFASIAKQGIEGMAAAERLMEIENLPKEEIYELSITTPVKSSSITFKNVSFQYDLAPVLTQASFTFPTHQMVALVGPSGHGKTTIIRLILSLLKPNSGQILINDEPLNLAHRQLMTYVPQGNTLFSGSIKDNIRFSHPSATDDEIIQAIKQAEAYDFIKQLDDGLDTQLGEKGIGLSEGQAQRICLARAFVSKKPILILDEATSALDELTELKILNNIKNLSHKPTCILITHRLKTLDFCDQVINLKNPR